MEFYENKNDPSHSIINIIHEMAADIRKSKNSIQRFHIYGKTLYHVQGFYNEHSDIVTFIIDNRARSDEYDSLLQQQQQLESVSHLAAGFAHELRNPLSIIRGFIQLSGLTGNVDKYYQTMISELDRMNEIIDDFLSLSRKTPKKELYEPAAFFQSLIPLIRSECLLKNVELSHCFEYTEKQLRLNKSMVKQIILNLLRNSVEAFHKGQEYKSFSIKGEIKENMYCITVSDNGSGIKQDVLEQLGKPFFTTKKNGTGIGLPLCKKIVKEHHNGEFNIESEVGKGTIITISLPFVQSNEE